MVLELIRVEVIIALVQAALREGELTISGIKFVKLTTKNMIVPTRRATPTIEAPTMPTIPSVLTPDEEAACVLVAEAAIAVDEETRLELTVCVTTVGLAEVIRDELEEEVYFQ